MRGSTALKAIAVIGLALGSTVTGCSCDETTTSTGPGSGGSGGSGGTGGQGGGDGGNGGTGGSGGTGGVLVGDGKISEATEVAKAGTVFRLAFDSASSPSGAIVYFTGINMTGDPAVFSAAGGTVTELASGAPLVAPFGIAVSTDGMTLYVSDPGAQTAGDDAGRIFSLSFRGGAVSDVSGGGSLVARSLDVVEEGGGDQIYFSGKKGGKAGVYKIAGRGGSAEEVATGAIFRDPSGLAVAKNGDIYVSDTLGGTYGDAAVIKIAPPAEPAVLANHLATGYPAGIALSQDETAILVSGLPPGTANTPSNPYGSSVVVRIDLVSVEQTLFPEAGTTSVFNGLFEPGGLHRAKKADVYTWVVADANGGAIFRLE